MTITKFSKNEHKGRKIKRKLKVQDYVFEIGGKDMYGVNIIHSFDYVESTIYEKGKKSDIIKEPVITIELSGKDKEGNDAWIYFDLKIDIDYLNTLSSVPTDISYLLLGSESFIKKPLEEGAEFLDFELPKNKKEDIYKKLSSLWILKMRENEFIIKLCVPDEVFTYFTLLLEDN